MTSRFIQSKQADPKVETCITLKRDGLLKAYSFKQMILATNLLPQTSSGDISKERA